MRILGLETTCDETAAAVVERLPDGNGRILSNVVFSQVQEHAAYGGVVPEIAARAHIEALDGIVHRALEDAGLGISDLDGIAAAAGPGLIGGVIVGLTMGKALALAAQIPFVGVNHLEGHALTPRLTDRVNFPYLLLLVSGGHTQLVAVEGVGQYHKLGTTIDDAMGEAFDKTAKLLGLPYPGGPAVESAANKGDVSRFQFPRPLFGRPDPDFSLAGLKTAVRLQAEKCAPLNDQDVADICAAFQAAIVDVLVDRVRAGLRRFRDKTGKPASTLVLAGGVAANQAVRRGLQGVTSDSGVRLVAPPVHLCGDNGAMIAWAGAERLALGFSDDMALAPRARWPLDEASAKPGARA